MWLSGRKHALHACSIPGTTKGKNKQQSCTCCCPWPESCWLFLHFYSILLVGESSPVPAAYSVMPGSHTWNLDISLIHICFFGWEKGAHYCLGSSSSRHYWLSRLSLEPEGAALPCFGVSRAAPGMLRSQNSSSLQP